MTKPHVSIIVLTYNDERYINECLKSVYDSTLNDVEVIVVDNASNDRSAEIVSTQFPRARLIRNRKNRGVASGRNQGIQEAHGRYIVFLDADAFFLEGALEKLITFMEDNLDVGIVASKLVYPSMELQYSCRTFPTPLTLLFRILGFLDTHLVLRRHLMLDYDHNEAREVDWAMGACQIIRREVFEKIGLLDEGYFYGYEDVDFCHRVWRAGRKVVYLPQAIVAHHYQRRSTKGIFNSLKFSHLKSALRFFYKRYFA